MVKDPPSPARISARAVLAIGLCSDASVPFLYYAFVEMSFRSRMDSFGAKLLVAGLLLSILFGIAGTFIGSVMWAWRASSGSVAMAIFGVVLAVLLYANRAEIGFDDPKIMVVPCGLLVALLLFVGRVVGHAISNRK
jgi:hypothetical protein